MPSLLQIKNACFLRSFKYILFLNSHRCFWFPYLLINTLWYKLLSYRIKNENVFFFPSKTAQDRIPQHYLLLYFYREHCTAIVLETETFWNKYLFILPRKSILENLLIISRNIIVSFLNYNIEAKSYRNAQHENFKFSTIRHICLTY